MEMYAKYKSNMLGVISDVGFTVHRGDSPDMEKLDAGIELVRHIRRASHPWLQGLAQVSLGNTPRP